MINYPQIPSGIHPIISPETLPGIHSEIHPGICSEILPLISTENAPGIDPEIALHILCFSSIQGIRPKIPSGIYPEIHPDPGFPGDFSIIQELLVNPGRNP